MGVTKIEQAESMLFKNGMLTNWDLHNLTTSPRDLRKRLEKRINKKGYILLPEKRPNMRDSNWHMEYYLKKKK